MKNLSLKCIRHHVLEHFRMLELVTIVYKARACSTCNVCFTVPDMSHLEVPGLLIKCPGGYLGDSIESLRVEAPPIFQPYLTSPNINPHYPLKEASINNLRTQSPTFSYLARFSLYGSAVNSDATSHLCLNIKSWLMLERAN